jgi:hypothetical protein
VAKLQNRFWTGAVGPLDFDGDVGEWQIRATTYANGCLLLHKADADDAPFALVVGVPPVVRVAGWLYGYEGKREQFWRSVNNRPPCYMVPQDVLHEWHAAL